MARSLKIGAAAGAALIGGYFIVKLLTGGSYVPVEFSEARIQGAALAGEILALSSETLSSLPVIASLDEAGKKSEALALISKEIMRSNEVRAKAVALSSQLEQMARTIDGIKPAKAREVATEAVSSEVALVSRLITYNDLLVQLFQTLRDKFENPNADTDGKVQPLIDEINVEAKAINDFNGKFNQSLEEFDTLV
jgi:hypothetical protein